MPSLSTLGVIFAAALVLPPIAAAASSPAVVTILEGSVTVFRGTSKLGASEGVRIQPNDLVETGKDTFARLEFDDGTRLDLGSGTRLQVNNPGETTGDRPALYVLGGYSRLHMGPSGRDASDLNALHTGLGARVFFAGEHAAVRLEARAYYRGPGAGFSSQDEILHIVGTVGMSFFVGPK